MRRILPLLLLLGGCDAVRATPQLLGAGAAIVSGAGTANPGVGVAIGLGVTAFALVCVGLDPLLSQQGVEDLFGKPLRITTEAIADQLATAANFVMGNAGQSTPAAIIRAHGLRLSDFAGWVPGIEP